MSLRSRLQQIPVFWTKREVLGASEPVQVLFGRLTVAVAGEPACLPGNRPRAGTASVAS